MGFRTFTSRLKPKIELSERLSLDELRTPKARHAYDQALPWLDLLTRYWEPYLNHGGFPVSVAPPKAVSGWTPRERSQGKLYAIDPVVARLTHLRNPARPDIDPDRLDRNATRHDAAARGVRLGLWLGHR
jgi:hypothetical protein